MGAPPQPAVTSPLRNDEPATAVDMWKRRVAAMPDRVAFRHWSPAAGRWVALTWKEADAAAREIAGGLVARGVVPGDRVCVLAQTNLEWILSDVGILLAGGVTVPIYPSSTAEQCEFIVRDSGAKIVILEDAAQLEKILSVRDHLLTVTAIVHMAGDAKLEKADARGRSVVTLAEVTRGLTDLVAVARRRCAAAGRTWLAAHAGELDGHAETVAPDSMFTIIYTSGTTGTPKGVVLTHENLVAGVSSAIRAMQIYDADEQYLFLTLAHVLARELEWTGIAPRVLDDDLARRREHQDRTCSRRVPPSWRACRASTRSSTRASTRPSRRRRGSRAPSRAGRSPSGSDTRRPCAPESGRAAG